ncbi:MAG: hypothetical protein KF901_32280 [Myxococcales bacterium]|nr:hypothetical protein [Myxococcales bacterium]
MDLRFLAPDLRRFDRTKAEALLVTLFEDERPLRGTSGLVDWRYGGFLSRQLREGRVMGRRGEVCLLPGEGRLTFEKVFLVGLGPSAGFDDETFDEGVRLALDVFRRAKVRTAFVSLPGRNLGRIAPAAAMERLLTLSRAVSEPDELTLLEDADAQREMEPVLFREQRRARAFAG